MPPYCLRSNKIIFMFAVQLAQVPLPPELVQIQQSVRVLLRATVLELVLELDLLSGLRPAVLQGPWK